jgi:protein-L-isoaspartate(D-aspartate) O-methyltransferase
MDDEFDYETRRWKMVEEQLRERDITDEGVLRAMGKVPRHLFVLPEHRYRAYADGPLPIGEGQTISQPYIVALMAQMLELYGDERVLEIGTGSGYQAAVLAHLGREVHTVERHESLARRAEQILNKVGLSNVSVHVGDGSLGWPENAPYQAILVTAAAPKAPQPLLDQLDESGRLVLPVGSMGAQFLERWRRKSGDFTREVGIAVAFVPLRGKHGWQEEGWWGY